MAGISSTGVIGSKASKLLERIGWRQKDLQASIDSEEPSLGSSPNFSRPPLTLSTLQNIHKQWLLSVPFECMSIHCGDIIELDIDKIYDKVRVLRLETIKMRTKLTLFQILVHVKVVV